MSAGLSAQLTVSAFNRLGQYASSPCNMPFCYAELAVSSLAMTVTIYSLRLPTKDYGQGEFTRIVD